MFVHFMLLNCDVKCVLVCGLIRAPVHGARAPAGGDLERDQHPTTLGEPRCCGDRKDLDRQQTINIYIYIHMLCYIMYRLLYIHIYYFAHIKTISK